MSVAQAMIETAHKKIKNANSDMVLNKKQQQRTVEEKKVINWHAKRGACNQKEKEWRLIDSKM